MKNPDQLRHILKTISWRIVGTIDTMVVSFFITGSIKVGVAIGGFEVFTKMVLYYFHERLWFSYVSLGRSTSATSDLPLATGSDSLKNTNETQSASSNQKLETRNLQTATSNSPLAPSFDVSEGPVSSSKSEVSSNTIAKESQSPEASSQMPEDFSQKPETNIVHQSYSISLNERIEQNNHSPKVFWMTGLSGSGKSTIANALQNELFQKGYQVYVLDGDNVRGGLNKDLDFSDEGRIENIRRISEVAKLFADAGFVVITAFISPFQSDREQAKNIIGSEYFCEVFVDTPLEICEQRDVKGLYKKARAGEIPNFTGIGSAFEKPEKPDVQVKTQEMEVTECVKLLERLRHLATSDWLPFMQISQNKYRLNKGEESNYSVIQSMRNHENLIIWKDSLTIVNEVYRLVKLLPKQESYGLYSQMTRAAISISSNIAEGCSRSSKKEFSRFLEISIGSAFELQTQLIIVRENYRVPRINSLIDKTKIIQRQISSYKSKIN